MKNLVKLLVGLAILSPVSFAAGEMSNEEQQDVNIWDLCTELKSRYHVFQVTTDLRTQISEFIQTHEVEDLTIPYHGDYMLYHIPYDSLPIHILGACEENELARALAEKLMDHEVQPSYDEDFKELVEELFSENYQETDNVEHAIKRIIVTGDTEDVLEDLNISQKDLLEYAGLLEEYREYLKENLDEDEVIERAGIDPDEEEDVEEELEWARDELVEDKIEKEEIPDNFMDRIKERVTLTEVDQCVISAYENQKPLEILNVLLQDEVWEKFLDILAQDIAEE